jgi:predicted alpha/beta-hydrolase family hydrolase
MSMSQAYDVRDTQRNMTTNLTITTLHDSASARLELPSGDPIAAVLLAHGAGAGQDHPWMVLMQHHLTEAGFATMTFNYAYTEAGRKAPDRLPRLIDVHMAAAARLAEEFPDVVLAGKSMGGRVGGHVVAEHGFEAKAVVYLGYPLVALGKSEPRDIGHLSSIDVRQLFVSGTRDRFGPRDLISGMCSSVPNGRCLFVEDGDHSLVPLKRTGLTVDDSLRSVAGEMRDLVTD